MNIIRYTKKNRKTLSQLQNLVVKHQDILLKNNWKNRPKTKENFKI